MYDFCTTTLLCILFAQRSTTWMCMNFAKQLGCAWFLHKLLRSKWTELYVKGHVHAFCTTWTCMILAQPGCAWFLHNNLAVHDFYTKVKMDWILGQRTHAWFSHNLDMHDFSTTTCSMYDFCTKVKLDWTLGQRPKPLKTRPFYHAASQNPYLHCPKPPKTHPFYHTTPNNPYVDQTYPNSGYFCTRSMKIMHRRKAVPKLPHLWSPEFAEVTHIHLKNLSG